MATKKYSNDSVIFDYNNPNIPFKPFDEAPQNLISLYNKGGSPRFNGGVRGSYQDDVKPLLMHDTFPYPAVQPKKSVSSTKNVTVGKKMFGQGKNSECRSLKRSVQQEQFWGTNPHGIPKGKINLADDKENRDSNKSLRLTGDPIKKAYDYHQD